MMVSTERMTNRTSGERSRPRRSARHHRPRLAAVLALTALALGGLVLPPLSPTGVVQAAPGDPFDPADPTVFIAQNTPTQLFTAVAAPDGTVSFAPEGPAAGWNYNAIGYNPANNFVYGIKNSAGGTGTGSAWPVGAVIRIGQEGVITRVGTSTIGSGANWGAFGGDGFFYVGSGGVATAYRINPGTGAVTNTYTLPTNPVAVDFTFAHGYFWGANSDGQIVRMSLGGSPTVTVFPGAVLPSGSFFGANWTYGNGNLGFSRNEDGTVYQVAITNPASASPTFTVVSSQSGPASGNNDGAASLGLPTDLGIEKAGPEQFAPGGSLTYSLTVTNHGAGNSSGWVVSDTIPAPLTNVGSPTPGCTVSGNTVTCAGGRLEVDQAVEIEITADSPAGQTACVTNTATVLANETDPNLANNTASVVSCPAPGMTIDKSTSTTLVTEAGQVVPFTFVVTNVGGYTIEDVAVSDPMVGTVDCPSTSLSPGAQMNCTASYEVTQADVDSGGPIVNVATVTGEGPDGPLDPEPSDPVEIPVTSNPAIALVKSADPIDGEITEPDQQIDYTFVVTNSGNVTLTGVTVTDPMDGLSPLDCLPGMGSSLLPGEQMVCTASYLTTQADVDAGMVGNTATTDATDPDGQPVSDDDSVTVPSVIDPSLDLEKSANLTEVGAAGAEIVYTFVATNTGNVSLDAVTVSDPMDGLSAIDCSPVAGSGLLPGQNMTCTATYTVTQDDIDAGTTITNVATVTGDDPDGDPLDPEPSDPVDVTIANDPSISITKSASPDDQVPPAGDTIDYSFVVVNTGNVTLTDVVVSDPLLDDADPPAVIDCIPAAPSELSPGGQMNCTASYIVTQDDVDHSVVVNEATVEGTAPDDAVVSDSDTASVPGVLDPSLSLVKAADVAEVDSVGDEIVYTFTATNTGNVTLGDVVIGDSLPGLSPLDCTPAQPATLLPGEPLDCTAVYVVTQADLDSGGVTNVASATGDDPGGDPIDPVPSNPVVVGADPNPDLTIAKSTGVTEVDAVGDVITYSFTVTNTGNVTLTDVTVDDPLVGPAALDCTPAQPALLTPGDVMTCTADYVVTQADLDGGTPITNVATVSGTSPDGPVPPVPSNEVEVPVTHTPSVMVVKSADPIDELPPMGDEITYSFVVTNTGNVTLTDVAIDDPMVGLSDPDCTPTQGATLSPGEQMICTASYTVTQADVDAGSVENEVTATGVPPDGPPVDETSTVQVPAEQSPGIELDKSANVTVVDSVGDLITYTFVATNIGNVTLTSVVIDDPMPGLSELDCSPAQPVTLVPGQAISCSATYAVTQADLDSGEAVTNTAVVDGDGPGGDPIDPVPSDPVEVGVTQQPGISLVKSADPIDELPAVDELITYGFVISNTGNVTLDDVDIDDPLLDPSDFDCSSPLPATLAPGAQITCTAEYEVTQADVDAGSVENVATASGSPPVGPDVDDTDSVTVPAEQAPAISLEKSADVTEVESAGDPVVYVVVATNTGNVTLFDVVIDDPMFEPADLDCTPAQPATLIPGETLSCSATYVVSASDIDAGEVVNLAVVDAEDGSGNEVTDDAEYRIGVDQQPALEVVKSSPSSNYGVGDTIQYEFVVTNVGNVTIGNVAIADPLLDDPGADCELTALAAGVSTTCTGTRQATQADVDAGSIVNTATAIGSPPDGPPIESPESSTTVQSEPPEPALELVKLASAESFALAGEVLVFEFVITNMGNVTIGDIAVDDPMLDDPGATCESVVLAPNDSTLCTGTYTTTTADMAAGEIVNTAVATGTTTVTEVPVESPPATVTVPQDLPPISPPPFPPPTTIPPPTPPTTQPPTEPPPTDPPPTDPPPTDPPPTTQPPPFPPPTGPGTTVPPGGSPVVPSPELPSTGSPHGVILALGLLILLAGLAMSAAGRGRRRVGA